MALTFASAKDELAAILHTTTLDAVQNVNGLFFRAGRQLLMDIDPPETKRIHYLTLFDGIYDYTPPTDLKGSSIIDLRPQGIERSTDANFSVTDNEQFDYYKRNHDITVELRSGTKVLRVIKELTGKIVINDLDSLTANGTWAGTGGGTNATADATYKVQGSAGINFDVGATGGAIENSTMTQVDLTDHDERSTLFVWVYLPDSSIVTNVILRWGNDSSNYWSRTSTTPHFGSAFVNGWNLVSFAWNGATETGTVAPATIDYLRVTVTTTSSDTDIVVDEVTSRLPQVWELLYYSKFAFRSAAGTYSETINADDDLFNFDDDSYNLMLFKVAEYAGHQLGGKDAGYDVSYFQQQYELGKQSYVYNNASERQKRRSFYYKMR